MGHSLVEGSVNMRIKDYKCTCGNNNFFIADKGNQKGIYCSYCGKWLKWADKNEQNLAMMTESIPMSVIDEIKSEITKQGVNSGMLLSLSIIDEKIRGYCNDTN